MPRQVPNVPNDALTSWDEPLRRTKEQRLPHKWISVPQITSKKIQVRAMSAAEEVAISKAAARQIEGGMPGTTEQDTEARYRLIMQTCIVSPACSKEQAEKLMTFSFGGVLTIITQVGILSGMDADMDGKAEESFRDEPAQGVSVGSSV